MTLLAGQVYRATLKGTGEEVAIKVQRPGITPIIYRDLVGLARCCPPRHRHACETLVS
jgi:predicted unusual protein kinase regulating ubiquinone biosynthesis (AarF/ABC1/UbiB family)